MKPYSTILYRDIEVCTLPELEGGGAGFGQDYLSVVAHLFGKVGRVWELCAGPGCIGFSLLAHGLCDSLVLSDVNPVAVEAAWETVRRNGLEDRVTVYRSDGLSEIPPEERCDLFVANPPFFPDAHVPFMRESPTSPEIELRVMDPGLRLHRAFYGGMARFLSPGGSALIQECSQGCPPETFIPMIEAGGLDFIRTIWHTRTDFPFIYYMWAKCSGSSTLISDGSTVNRVTVELCEQSSEPLPLPAQVVHVLRLRNSTRQAVSVMLDGGGEWAPEPHRYNTFAEIPSGGEIDLPQMVLHPDRPARFRDLHSGATLATLRGVT